MGLREQEKETTPLMSTIQKRSPSNPLRLQEKDFQRSVVDYAKLCGWLVFHDFDSRRNARGYPDLTLVRSGRLVLVELKTEKGRLRPEQKAWLEALKTVANLEVYLWKPSDLDTIIEILR